MQTEEKQETPVSSQEDILLIDPTSRQDIPEEEAVCQVALNSSKDTLETTSIGSRTKPMCATHKK